MNITETVSFSYNKIYNTYLPMCLGIFIILCRYQYLRTIFNYVTMFEQLIDISMHKLINITRIHYGYKYSLKGWKNY